MEQENTQNEIVLYQPDDSVKLEVKLENETVWLTQQQIADLFGTKRPAITKHLNNIYNSGELDKDSTCSILEHMGNDGKQRYTVVYYNLDVILSVGYRVNSKNATLFRQWANKVLKEYLLRGVSVNQHLAAMQRQIDIRFDEQKSRLDNIEKVQEQQQHQVELLIRTNSIPDEKLFATGCVFDAWNYVSDLVRSAKNRIVLIDNYMDDRVLSLLSKRQANVSATVHTRYSKTFVDDLAKHNSQYPEITYIQLSKKNHDRFLIIDNVVYLLGASVKDMGTSLCAITRMKMPPDRILNEL